MAQRHEASRAQLQERLAQAEARATDAASRAHQLEGQAKQQERELLKVIAAKDALAAQSGKGDDAVGELRGRPKPNLEVRVSRNTSITSASEGERLSRMSATSVSQTPDRGKRLWRI